MPGSGRAARSPVHRRHHGAFPGRTGGLPTERDRRDPGNDPEHHPRAAAPVAMGSRLLRLHARRSDAGGDAGGNDAGKHHEDRADGKRSGRGGVVRRGIPAIRSLGKQPESLDRGRLGNPPTEKRPARRPEDDRTGMAKGISGIRPAIHPEERKRGASLGPLPGIPGGSPGGI